MPTTRELIEAEGFLTDEEAELISDFCAAQGSACEIWLSYHDAKKFAKLLTRGVKFVSVTGTREASYGEWETVDSSDEPWSDGSNPDDWLPVFREDNVNQWETIYRKLEPHEVSYGGLAEALTDDEFRILGAWSHSTRSTVELWGSDEDVKKVLKSIKQNEELKVESGGEAEASELRWFNKHYTEKGWEIVAFNYTFEEWEAIYRKRRPHEVAYESLQEKRMLSAFEQLKVLARRSTEGKIVFSDRINYVQVAPRDARAILAVWKQKSNNDKAKIERQVGKDETSFNKILEWARKLIRYRKESTGDTWELEGAFLHYPWDEFHDQYIDPYERFIEDEIPDWYVSYGDLWKIPGLTNPQMYSSIYKDGEVVPLTYTFFSPEQAEEFILRLGASLEDWDYPDSLTKV